MSPGSAPAGASGVPGGTPGGAAGDAAGAGRAGEGAGGVAGVVLAAGAGRRFGGPKALVELGGALLVERAARVLAEAGCAPVVVVLGAAADEVRARADLTGVVTALNPDWPTGMGSSLRVGLAELADVPGVRAAAVLPVDTPGVTAAAVRRVIAHAATAVDARGARSVPLYALVRATYRDGAPGHPVLLGRAHWPGVAELAVGDAGAREYLRRHPPLDVPCADLADGADVDRPEDLPRD